MLKRSEEEKLLALKQIEPKFRPHFAFSSAYIKNELKFYTICVWKDKQYEWFRIDINKISFQLNVVKHRVVNEISSVVVVVGPREFFHSRSNI